MATEVPTEVATQRGVTSQISGVAKSEDAPTREVTAAAKCGEVAETCKNYLFYVKIRIQNAKGREVLVAVHCTIY